MLNAIRLINDFTFALRKKRLSECTDINQFEYKIYSQYGEDGIIDFIFSKIGTTNMYFVEIGAADGIECNTRLLLERKWHGLQLDAKDNPHGKKHFITKNNIRALFKKYQVPTSFDLLSIDIDGNDYWILDKLGAYAPRVIVTEYNGSLGPDKSVSMPYNENFTWDGTTFYGVSLAALEKMLHKRGYQLVGTTSNGVNAFFIRAAIAKKIFPKQTVKKLYHPSKYDPKTNQGRTTHPRSSRMNEMVTM